MLVIWPTIDAPRMRGDACVLTSSDHLLAPAAVLAVVLLMIVPLPPLLLDLLLSIDIGLAVVLLLTAIYVRQPVEFSVFPSLLLLLTLIRLSLNVASTRLVLLQRRRTASRRPARVIMAFGQFVVGGNFVVGVVVFLVLIAIQYIVINHGAVRISEVTARFTLDAMPGPPDGDRRRPERRRHRREGGARAARSASRREADFYGSMDGAIRFTQRDALAAVLITVVNIVAGLIIGVLQHGLDLATAAETYTHPDGRRGPGHGDPGAARVDGRRSDHDARRRPSRTSAKKSPRSCSRARVRSASPPVC